MAVDRPTFSESWYRLADLRPRLRATLQTHRQHFRGQMWHVVQDPSNNQFFRLNETAYRFIALLDGRRNVAEAWQISNEQLGDGAPTQGEAIQLLGQLYTSNLLQAELPPDAEGLFDRYRKRVQREIKGYLMNLLFIRIPLYDPDHFLNRWVGILGKVFTLPGFLIWLALIFTGLYFVVGNARELYDARTGILNPDNLVMLYLSIAVVKIFHEFSHSFACKKFGRQCGTTGEVHVMGVMFLVFMPLPYMDASSAWAMRNKWHRAIVGMAGILTELAFAAVAAIVWANTGPGTLRAICYNIMFIASVNSLLFNGNALLRFDAYYILSDLVEIPNLAQRSKNYIYYLVRRYVWGVRKATSPAHTRGERAWFVVYGFASTIYRFFICFRILMFVSQKFFLVGAVLAIAAVITWVMVPLGKFVHYLATSGELLRVRPRAVLTTVIFLAAVIGGISMIPAPDRERFEGVVEPRGLAVIYTGADGFVKDFLPSGKVVHPRGPPLMVSKSVEIETELEMLLAGRRKLNVQLDVARAPDTRDVVRERQFTKQIGALDKRIARVREQLAALAIQVPFRGTWISPQVERFKGAYLERGRQVGLVATPNDLIIRAMAGQNVAFDQMGMDRVEIRVKGLATSELTGRIEDILPAGTRELPSDSLGYAAGGSIQTTADDRRRAQATEPLFEIRIKPDPDSGVRLFSGQRVVVRVELPTKPLIQQWWRSLLQLIQKRFRI